MTLILNFKVNIFFILFALYSVIEMYRFFNIERQSSKEQKFKKFNYISSPNLNQVQISIKLQKKEKKSYNRF